MVEKVCNNVASNFQTSDELVLIFKTCQKRVKNACQMQFRDGLGHAIHGDIKVLKVMTRVHDL